MKIRPGARFGMAVPIAGEVRLIPLRNRDWNNVTLHAMIPTIYKNKKHYTLSPSIITVRGPFTQIKKINKWMNDNINFTNLILPRLIYF